MISAILKLVLEAMEHGYSNPKSIAALAEIIEAIYPW